MVDSAAAVPACARAVMSPTHPRRGPKGNSAGCPGRAGWHSVAIRRPERESDRPTRGGRGISHLGTDDRVDGERAARAGDGDTVMAVADRVPVADRTTEIGGSTAPRCSAIQTLCQRARTGGAGRKSRSNWATRLGSRVAVMCIQRDLAQPETGAGGGPTQRALVVNGEPRAVAAAAQAPRQRGASARSRGRAERLLGLDLAPGAHASPARAPAFRARYGVPVAWWPGSPPARLWAGGTGAPLHRTTHTPRTGRFGCFSGSAATFARLAS